MGNFVALVPLRGGSKSIPDKNIREIAGKPLCAWVLEAACHSGMFSQVVVSTDSDKIISVVRGLGLPVEIIRRPDELATDSASTESVMLHAAQVLSFDVLVTIQATSPLVTSHDLRAACECFSSNGYDSLLSAIRVKRFYWSEDGNALNYDPIQRPRRQDFSGSFMENGAFYMTRRTILENFNCRLGGRIGIYEMDADTGVEIDEAGDWHVVEKILRRQQRMQQADTLSAIKLLVVDVDGTLTDAGMYWSSTGEELKKFNTRDAKGLELVRKQGVTIAIMTAEQSPIVHARAEKLGIAHCFTGVHNKKESLIGLTRTLGVTLSETAFIGDDVNDCECLKMVGFSSCPADAVDIVKETVCYVSSFQGGHGAVRDVCEMICKYKQKDTTTHKICDSL